MMRITNLRATRKGRVQQKRAGANADPLGNDSETSEVPASDEAYTLALTAAKAVSTGLKASPASLT